MRAWSIRCAALWLLPLLFACSGANNQISKTDVQLAAGDIRTFAYSAELLLEECSAGNATSTFCEEQSDFLSDKVADAIKELDGDSPDAESERKELAEISASLREIITREQQKDTRPTDAADAGRIGAVSKTIEESLRK
jgi:hypothetical protein